MLKKNLIDVLGQIFPPNLTFPSHNIVVRNQIKTIQTDREDIACYQSCPAVHFLKKKSENFSGLDNFHQTFK